MSSTPSTQALDGSVIASSREVLSKKARSFRWGAQFLSPERHDDAAILYAYCREVDDTADEAPSFEHALAGLNALEAELMGESEPRPLMSAFLEVARRCNMPTSWPRELIIGVRQDLEPVRVADDVELLRYCYRVAGIVGLMMCGVLEVEDKRAWAHAIDLGIGMQLTNICRDVAEDAQMGRVYLPKTRLSYYGQRQEALLEGQANREAVSRVVTDLLELADVYYQSARKGMRYIPSRSRAAILVAAGLYQEIGHRLNKRHQGDALRGRTIVPWTRKSTRAITSLSAMARPDIAGIWPHATHDRQLHVALEGLPGANCAHPHPGDGLKG